QGSIFCACPRIPATCCRFFTCLPGPLTSGIDNWRDPSRFGSMHTETSRTRWACMTRRSRAREVALQLLFQRDLNASVDRAAVERFALDRLRDPGLAAFCLQLFDGVIAHAEAIDRELAAAAENWRLPRMAGVDRNV